MSRYQPTLREAQEQVAIVERCLLSSVQTVPVEGGFRVRFKLDRYDWPVLWPVSDISRRCDDCKRVLRVSRDAGGHGFYYDKRWMIGDPATRDPRLSHRYTPHYVCLSCFNRARPVIRVAETVNQNRLTLNRIKRELYNAA